VSETTVSDSREAANDQKDWHFIGHVEMDRGGDTKIYADDVRAYTGENRAIATGNVVLAQGNDRLSAERAEFDTETRLGTFYNAWGLATVKAPVQAPRPGTIAPPAMAGQENVVYFFGEKIEKIGPKKYRITNGGFSTCVQPTPRWDLTAGTVLLNVDHYTLLKQAVLRVKGVPLLYLPVLYYPTKRDQRATGFLIPAYGSSSVRGQSLHNAFFWAIDRSQDATILHDWFSKTGQGYGSEYRYNAGAGDGNIRAYLDDQHGASYTTNGVTQTTNALRSYDIRGGANQQLPGHLRARANVDYFSSIVQSLTFNTDINAASRSQRSYGGNLVGAWGKYSMNTTLDHREWFQNTTQSAVSGTWPRVTFTRNERPIANSPAYFSVSSDFSHILRDSKTGDIDVDTGLSRFDVSPQIRYPFKKWSWFTVNSTLNWRNTYYTRSYEPTGDPTVRPTKVIDVPLNRPVLSFQAQITGPVFNRVWDTPGNGYAEKFKHTIEPYVTVDRTANVANFDRVVIFDGIDTYIGGTRLSYGLNNRFYAKRRLAPGQPAQAREIASIEISQSYFTNQAASVIDLQSQIRADYTQPVNFNPLTLSVRTMPTTEVTATVRADFDAKYRELRQVSAQGTYSWTSRVQTTATWSKKAFIEGLAQFNDKQFLDHYLSASANVHTIDNRVGGLRVQLRRAARRLSAAADLRVLQLAVLRPRLRIPGVHLSLPAHRGDRDPGRPALLPVVHARRSREFLPIQRRAERRAALTVSDAWRYSRHRRRWIRR